MRIVHRNFTGGEVDATLGARYDLAKYATSVQCMENFLPGLHGDVARRPGTRMVAELGQYSLLLPFRFNGEARQNFGLLLSHRQIRVTDGRSMLPPVLASPYLADHLADISYAQVGDVIYLAHNNYPLHKIMRSGTAPNYTWELRQVVLNASLPAPAMPTVSFVWNLPGNENDDTEKDMTYPLRYKVVAVDARGNESLPSAAGQCMGKYPTDWVRGNCAKLQWQAVPGAAEYNIFREDAGYFGFVGISAQESFVDNNFQADVTDTPREDWDPFAEGNYPGVVAFHQQRMVLANTPRSPQSFYMSRVGDFENFRKSRPARDDDPVEYALASGSIDAITWAASFGDLLLGTSGSEYKAGGDGQSITTKNITITAQSYWGSARLRPIIIGNSILHVQRHGARVRDLFYSLEKDGYAGNDLSIMAPHLFEGHTLRQWAYQQSPGSHIWIVRDDGVLLCLTYLKEHDIFGWSRHITAGEVISVASLSGDNADEVLLVVRRRGERGESYFLERMAASFGNTTPVEEAYFVDCGCTLRRDEASTEVQGLFHLEGQAVAVLADGSPVQGMVVHNGELTLPFAAKVVHVGLPYVSTLAPLPVEADTKSGSTLGKRRAYGACLLRLQRSVGGKYGPGRGELYDLAFVPDEYDAPCEVFSGDREFTPGGGQDAATTVWVVQDAPLPMHVVAVMCDVDFGEN